MKESVISSQRPTKSNAQDAAATFLGHERFTLTRYPTGLCHYVFEVIPDSGPKVPVRMGHEDTRKHLEGSVFWDMELMPLKLSTARILHHELGSRFDLLELRRNLTSNGSLGS